MEKLYCINEWSMDSLIGWYHPCLDLVQDDMDTFTSFYPYIEPSAAFEN